MIIREIINLYKLNWKAHLWSLLIPLGMIILLIKEDDDTGLSVLMAVGLYWFNGAKFTLKNERLSGLDKINAILPLERKKLLLSRMLYFYLNCIVYLVIIMTQFSSSGDSHLTKMELTWMFIVGNLVSIHQYIKFGKKKKTLRIDVKNDMRFIMLFVITLVLGLVSSNLLKVIGVIFLIILMKITFDDLLNYYPINRELSEIERY